MSKANPETFIHDTADVSDLAKIGKGTTIWNNSQVREGASIGENCTISKGVYIDKNVSIGDNTKIQNYVSVFDGVTLEGDVFIGPHVCFTNDKKPRSVNVEGKTLDEDSWVLTKTLVKRGASIGANSTILSNITIGKHSMIGAGSVVTKDIPDYALFVGNPARLVGTDKDRDKEWDLERRNH